MQIFLFKDVKIKQHDIYNGFKFKKIISVKVWKIRVILEAIEKKIFQNIITKAHVTVSQVGFIRLLFISEGF